MCMVELADETVTILSEHHPVARKEHRCSECGRVIKRGEKYLVEGYLFDGEKKTHKTCAHCEVVRSWLIHECNGFIYGGIAEDIHEHAQEGYGFSVLRLAAGVKKRWERRDGRLWPIPKAA